MRTIRPLLPEDIFSFRFLSDVQLSPDGSRVAYVVKTADRERDRYRAAIWVVDVASGASRQLTSGANEDLLPRWSPDSARISFVSDRGDVPPGKERAPRNLFLVTVGGGEERQLTSFDNDVKDLAWSPDGARLVAVAKPSWPAGEREPAIREYDELRYRTDEDGLLDLRRRHLWLVDVTSGAVSRLTDGDWDDVEPSWSADGRELAFISNRTPERDRNTVRDVWAIGADGSNERRVTPSDGSQEHPSFSPDARTIAYFGHRDARASNAVNHHLWVSVQGTPGPRDLLAGWDRTVGSVVITDMRGLTPVPPPAWTTDGARLYFIGSDAGTANLYEASFEGGMPRQVTRGDQQIVTASFDRARKTFAALVSTSTDPGNVFSGDLASGKLRRLTDLNPWLAETYVSEPKRVAFAGADGWEIEGWYLTPPGFDPQKRYPLVLQIHGGPHTAYGHSFFHEFQALAGAGYVVLYTNPRGSHTYGERFVHACVGDWGGKDMTDLFAAVDHLVALGFVDSKRLGVTGGSYGGFMTNWMVGHDKRFAAAATARSISNNSSSFGTSDIGWHFWEYEMGDADPYADPERYARYSPLTYAKDVETPLLLLHAENDRRCPIEQAEQLFTALRYLGKTARFIRYPKDSHELTRGGKPSNRAHHMASLIGWFDRYLASN